MILKGFDTIPPLLVMGGASEGRAVALAYPAGY